MHFKNFLPHMLQHGVIILSCISMVRIKIFFSFKNKLPKMLLSGLVDRYQCGGCNASYCCKTKRHFKVRIWEHLGISHLTGKQVKIENNKLTAIQNTSYVLTTLHPLNEDFSILIRESNDFKLKILEYLLIARNKTDLKSRIPHCL